MKSSKIFLDEIAVIQRSGGGKPILSIVKNSNEFKHYVKEIIPFTNFKKFYVWEISLEDIIIFLKSKKNSTLAPNESETIFKIENDNIISVEKSSKEFINSLGVSEPEYDEDGNSQNPFVCDDFDILNTYIKQNF